METAVPAPKKEWEKQNYGKVRLHQKNKEKEKDEIQAQIDSVLEKIFNEDSYNNENSQIKGMAA